jgi:proteasome activator subunit 4
VDYILQAFNDVDYNAEMTFDAIKILSLFRAFYEELGRKFSAWTDDAVRQCWAEINSEHDEVGSSIHRKLIINVFSRFAPISGSLWPSRKKLR